MKRQTTDGKNYLEFSIWQRTGIMNLINLEFIKRPVKQFKKDNSFEQIIDKRYVDYSYLH